jgi:predicted dinucleotide-binding enzyme
MAGKISMSAASSAKEIATTNVIVVIGAGSIGQAIARRISADKHIVLGDLSQEHSDAAAKVLRTC